MLDNAVYMANGESLLVTKPARVKAQSEEKVMMTDIHMMTSKKE